LIQIKHILSLLNFTVLFIAWLSLIPQFAILMLDVAGIGWIVCILFYLKIDIGNGVGYGLEVEMVSVLFY